MIVTSDSLAALFTNFRVIWEDAFQAAQNADTEWQRLVLTVPSSTDTETYGWMGTVPAMKEWTDTRQLSGLGAYNYSLKNRHFEVSLEVDRDTIEDDRYGQIRPRIEQLGAEAARHPGQLAIETLVAGSTGNSYDGVDFFSASHVSGLSGTQANTLTGTGVTLSAIRTDMIAARTAMRVFKDDQGRIMNLMADLVVIPPQLQDVFEQLLNTTIIALSSGTQQSNVLQGAYDVMVSPYLTDADDWYLMSTRGSFKPLIYQTRKAPEFNAVDDPRDSQVFDNRKFKYGVDARYAFGYGMWQMAIRTTN